MSFRNVRGLHINYKYRLLTQFKLENILPMDSSYRAATSFIFVSLPNRHGHALITAVIAGAYDRHNKDSARPLWYWTTHVDRSSLDADRSRCPVSSSSSSRNYAPLAVTGGSGDAHDCRKIAGRLIISSVSIRGATRRTTGRSRVCMRLTVLSASRAPRNEFTVHSSSFE